MAKAIAGSHGSTSYPATAPSPRSRTECVASVAPLGLGVHPREWLHPWGQLLGTIPNQATIQVPNSQNGDEMRQLELHIVVIGALVVAVVGACRSSVTPVPPYTNRSPHILSVTVFPSELGPTDSVVVICNAIDPDADTLVYDWDTDGKLHISGANGNEPFLYNTSSNAQVFYPSGFATLPDTAWVHCVARDGKGGEEGRLVLFRMHQ
jgi:hypothetical protein